jgi:hypothetical protein
LDSPTGSLAGTCVITGTGGWQNWVTKSCSVSGLSGIHNIYLKFTGGSGYLFNINWWKFKPEPTGVAPEEKSSSNETPYSYCFGQNYPNPFNPTTVIRYQLPIRSNMSLKVYDLLGQEIVTLFEGVRQPGIYEATFDGSKLTGGIYFYRLTTNTGFVKTNKSLLLK